LVTANAQISGGAITGTPISGSTGDFTTLSASAGITGTLSTAYQPNVTGLGTLSNLTVSGTTTAGLVNAATLATGNAQISGGVINSTPISGSTGVFTTMTTANAQISGGAITSTPISGSTGSFTTLAATTGTVTNLTSGNVALTGGTITGTPISGSTGAFTTMSTSGAATVNSLVTANAQVTGGAITGTPISGSTGSFTTLVAATSTVTGQFTANANIASTSTSTGSIVVIGGVGVSGNVNIGSGSTINSNKTAVNTVIKGVNDDSLLFASASTDQVMIGGNVALSSGFTAGAKLQINSNDSIILPVGTSGQRPATPVAGMTRYNSTLNQLEFWNGSQWASTETVFTLITDQQFTGDGTTTNFVLNAASTTNSTIVSINGVVQIPGLAYSVAGTTLQFSGAPLTTDVIDARVLVTTQTISGLASPNGFNQIIPDDTALQVWTGLTSSTNTWKFDGATGALLPVGAGRDIGSPTAIVDNIYASNVVISGGSISGVSFSLSAADNTPIGAVTPSTGKFTTAEATTTLTLSGGAPLVVTDTGTSFGTTATVIDSFPLATYRTAKYIVSVSNGSSYQAAEVLVVHDGSLAYVTTYAVLSSTGVTIATFTVDVLSGNILLKATGTGAGNVAKVQKIYIAV
jgi:hypothetical protein